MNIRGVATVLFFVPLVVAACAGAASAPVAASGGPPASAPATSGASPASAGATQTSEGGQVTVVATWRGPATGATFDVKIDTHSVDLDALDLSNAVLRNDRGEMLAAQPWPAPKGGHHREGTLAFGGDSSGFLIGSKWIELAIVGVGDVPERSFRWETGS